MFIIETQHRLYSKIYINMRTTFSYKNTKEEKFYFSKKRRKKNEFCLFPLLFVRRLSICIGFLFRRVFAH